MNKIVWWYKITGVLILSVGVIFSLVIMNSAQTSELAAGIVLFFGIGLFCASTIVGGALLSIGGGLKKGTLGAKWSAIAVGVFGILALTIPPVMDWMVSLPTVFIILILAFVALNAIFPAYIFLNRKQAPPATQ